MEERDQRDRERERDCALVVSAKVFVGDPPAFDQNVFELWLSNLAPEKATRVRARECGSLVPQTPAQLQLLLDDTLDQYRTYNLLQHYLSCPMLFLQSSPIPLAPHIRSTMIGLYYDVDTAVARQVLGKKLDTKRDYDDLAEATNLSAGYCRRHYENFRRVYKQACTMLKSRGSGSGTAAGAVGGGGGAGSSGGDTGAGGDKAQTLTGVIQHDFQLSPAVATKYAVIVFFCKHQFETQRRKLVGLDFAAFSAIAFEMMEFWTQPNRFLIDLQFLDTLRLVSEILRDSKLAHEYLSLAATTHPAPSAIIHLNPSASATPTPGTTPPNPSNNNPITTSTSSTSTTFGTPNLGPSVPSPSELLFISPRGLQLLKTLLKISSRLTSARELRDLFEDLYDKVVEPHRTDTDLVPFLSALLAAFPLLRGPPALMSREALGVGWTSFLRLVLCFVTHMTR